MLQIIDLSIQQNRPAPGADSETPAGDAVKIRRGAAEPGSGLSRGESWRRYRCRTAEAWWSALEPGTGVKTRTRLRLPRAPGRGGGREGDSEPAGARGGGRSESPHALRKPRNALTYRGREEEPGASLHVRLCLGPE
ncbi:hypothetical protein NDU88_002020 [Pleurodeles waltl]|uniref:Uncharacterized protein n=1 Tax=Pleurodeles waltl TaxID=8319 RepID=A0AAV7LB56_PLEWA|nr:hypothetical protein NDU88_002020 [Pleurodeles waltl]